jgi:hypothetical protein
LGIFYILRLHHSLLVRTCQKRTSLLFLLAFIWIVALVFSEKSLPKAVEGALRKGKWDVKACVRGILPLFKAIFAKTVS